MKPLQKAIAAHPLAEAPYNRIKFSRVGPHRTPLYKVGKGKREFGAEKALRIAFGRFGGRCFLCQESIEKEQFTLDHLRSQKDDGEDCLHNLVFACRPCNRAKGCKDLVECLSDRTSAYLKAVDAHLVRCLKKLDSK